MKAVLHFDGGCRPKNPGPAACAWVLREPSGVLIEEGAQYLGETTINVAEFQGLIHGLEAAIAHGVQHLTVYGDSKVIIHVMQGRYRARKTHLIELGLFAQEVSAAIPTIVYVWTSRVNNTQADALCGNLLDQVNSELGDAA